MGKVKLTLTLKGFDKLLEQIQEADGDIKEATERALEAGAKLISDDIRAWATARNIPTGNMIKPKAEWNGNRASIKAGFELGAYDPRKPSDGYLALFKEYGATADGGKRTTKTGKNRGRVIADPFIRPALTRNKKAVQAAQQKALEQILSDLGG